MNFSTLCDNDLNYLNQEDVVFSTDLSSTLLNEPSYTPCVNQSFYSMPFIYHQLNEHLNNISFDKDMINDYSCDTFSNQLVTCNPLIESINEAVIDNSKGNTPDQLMSSNIAYSPTIENSTLFFREEKEEKPRFKPRSFSLSEIDGIQVSSKQQVRRYSLDESLILDSQVKDSCALKRARNRLAALRCRERRKLKIENHVESIHLMNQENHSLYLKITGLQNEAFILHQLLAKTDPKCKRHSEFKMLHPA